MTVCVFEGKNHGKYFATKFNPCLMFLTYSETAHSTKRSFRSGSWTLSMKISAFTFANVTMATSHVGDVQNYSRNTATCPYPHIYWWLARWYRVPSPRIFLRKNYLTRRQIRLHLPQVPSSNGDSAPHRGRKGWPGRDSWLWQGGSGLGRLVKKNREITFQGTKTDMCNGCNLSINPW